MSFVKDGRRRVFLPAAGNSNGNMGTNGNYWSSTSGNYRLNFNTNNMNVNTNTNSYCVRLVAVVEYFPLHSLISTQYNQDYVNESHT